MSGVQVLGQVAFLAVPFVLLAVVLMRTTDWRTFEPRSRRPRRPGYLLGQLAGFFYVLAVPWGLRALGAPDWVTLAAFVGLVCATLAWHRWGDQESWFASGVPLGVVYAWIVVPIAVLPLVSLGAAFAE